MFFSFLFSIIDSDRCQRVKCWTEVPNEDIIQEHGVVYDSPDLDIYEKVNLHAFPHCNPSTHHDNNSNTSCNLSSKKFCLQAFRVLNPQPAIHCALTESSTSGSLIT
ncbi:hypothetical protein BDR04DRAFT_1154168 [Suillus decipiens]|nr:hypothetical protein BDR04DRAFT_1154168 [Suillus decipiens]